MPQHRTLVRPSAQHIRSHLSAAASLALLAACATTSRAQCSYRDTILADAPRAYWRLDETSGTIARDEVGPGPNGANPGQYLGGVALGEAGALAGSSSTCIGLFGGVGYVEVPDSPDLNFAGVPFSIEAWVYRSANFGSGCGAGCMKRIVNKVVAGTPFGYGLDMDDSSIRTLGSTNTGPGLGTTSGLPFSSSIDTWYHVVTVANAGGRGTTYVNGEAITTDDYAAVNPSSIPLRIGIADNGTARFIGRIDEVALYPSALTPHRVLCHYLAGIRAVRIQSQPFNTSAQSPHCDVSFSIAAAGGDPLEYRWQISDPADPSTWIDLSSGSFDTGTGTPLAITISVAPDRSRSSLSIQPPPQGSSLAIARRFIRCVVSDGCATAFSSVVRPAGPCVADYDDGSGFGACDGGVGIEDLLYYLRLYDEGLPAADLDDGTGSSTPDGGVGIEDLLVYLTRYDLGC